MTLFKHGITINGMNFKNHLFWLFLYSDITKTAFNIVLSCIKSLNGPVEETCSKTFGQSYMYIGI